MQGIKVPLSHRNTGSLYWQIPGARGLPRMRGEGGCRNTECLESGTVNEIIGKLFGKGKVSYAKNENGLLMLSKKITQNVHSYVFYPCGHPFLHFYRYPHHHSLSACIYTGDMRFDVKSCPTILDLLKMANEPLLLFQIPHHGSRRNSSAKYLQVLPSDLFFWHDKNYNRIYKNRIILTNIRPLYRLILIDTDTFLFCGFRIQ